jgi:hypothetical protein
MNELEISVLKSMCKDYLESDLDHLSKKVSGDIISNLMELNDAIKYDNFSMYVNPKDIKELYSLVESCSEVKSSIKPLFVATEHNFFDWMVSKNFLADIKDNRPKENLRDYELSKYEKLLQSVCKDMSKTEIQNGLEMLSANKADKEEALNKLADLLTIHYYSKMRKD